MITSGFLIAVEGVDGAGKRTQVSGLQTAFEAMGLEVVTYSFPDYAHSFLGKTVQSMLMGEFGPATEIHPVLSATLFSVERSEKGKHIQSDLASGKLVICDRYVYSNVAHQACRLPVNERRTFQMWVEGLEFDILGLPRPSATILLDVLDDEAERRRTSRSIAAQGTRPLDQYEMDEVGLATARTIYQKLASDLQWIRIPAFGNSPATITQNLLLALIPLLPHDIRTAIRTQTRS